MSDEEEKFEEQLDAFLCESERWDACCEERERLRALNAELIALLQGLINASDRQVSALPLIEEARAAIAKAKGET